MKTSTLAPRLTVARSWVGTAPRFLILHKHWQRRAASGADNPYLPRQILRWQRNTQRARPAGVPVRSGMYAITQVSNLVYQAGASLHYHLHPGPPASAAPPKPASPAAALTAPAPLVRATAPVSPLAWPVVAATAVGVLTNRAAIEVVRSPNQRAAAPEGARLNWPGPGGRTSPMQQVLQLRHPVLRWSAPTPTATPVPVVAAATGGALAAARPEPGLAGWQSVAAKIGHSRPEHERMVWRTNLAGAPAAPLTRLSRLAHQHNELHWHWHGVSQLVHAAQAAGSGLQQRARMRLRTQQTGPKADTLQFEASTRAARASLADLNFRAAPTPSTSQAPHRASQASAGWQRHSEPELNFATPKSATMAGMEVTLAQPVQSSPNRPDEAVQAQQVKKIVREELFSSSVLERMSEDLMRRMEKHLRIERERRGL